MLEQWRVKQKIDVADVMRKGTVGVMITFLAGALFGKENMMIAFVMVLGASTYDRQNLRVKTFYKIFHLMGRDALIVCAAFVASQSLWWGIPINLMALFIIIFTLLSPYDQMSYKTFMMLYVFSQYSGITWNELPERLLLIVFTLGCILASSLLDQMRKKAILDPNIGTAWSMLNEQLHQIVAGKFNEELVSDCEQCMGEVAQSIYRTGYKQYFTTYQGKIQFHFYMNIRYCNRLFKQLQKDSIEGTLSMSQIQRIVEITDVIVCYFKREIPREEVVKTLKKAGSEQEEDLEETKEITRVLKGWYRNFKELDELDYKRKNLPYGDWERMNARHLYGKLSEDFSMKSMRFNFAMRLAVVLTVSLCLAHLLGFYKMIWAIIPIMSVTKPYYEETMKFKTDRFKSNLLACLIVGILINFVNAEWMAFVLVIIGFYLVYAYKDYYRTSFFLTIISMSLSSFSKGINALIFYRLSYLIVGILVVDLSARILPYKIEDGMRELVEKISRLKKQLEEQRRLNLEGKENPHLIREILIHSALLTQHVCLKNKILKDEKINKWINENTDFMTVIGYQLLIE